MSALSGQDHYYQLSRAECVCIVRRLCEPHGLSEEELTALLIQLERDRPGVPWQDFIFWPSGVPHRADILEPTPEQIVDRAFAYEPVIVLPPPAAA